MFEVYFYSGFWNFLLQSVFIERMKHNRCKHVYIVVSIKGKTLSEDKFHHKTSTVSVCFLIPILKKGYNVKDGNI